jgi:putative sterol carrier protein
MVMESNEGRGIVPDIMSPEQFMAFVKSSSEEEIVSGVREAGVENALDQTFQAMKEHFLPEKAAGVDALVQYVVTDEGNEHAYLMAISAGTCELRKEKAANARVTLTTDLASFLKLVAGEAQGPMLFMTGKLKVGGDLMFSQRVASFFAQA